MSLTVENIYNILSQEFKIAKVQLAASKQSSVSEKERDAAYFEYLKAKNRWQCLFQVHGCLIGNQNWEANFDEFTEIKKYNSVEDCLKLARSYNNFP